MAVKSASLVACLSCKYPLLYSFLLTGIVRIVIRIYDTVIMLNPHSHTQYSYEYGNLALVIDSKLVF